MLYYSCLFRNVSPYMFKKRTELKRPTKRMIEKPHKYVHDWMEHEELYSRLHDQKVREQENKLDAMEMFCKEEPHALECRIYDV